MNFINIRLSTKIAVAIAILVSGLGLANTVQALEPVVGVTGAELWLDASDTSTLFTNSTCTTGVLAPGNSVACWKDKANNRTFNQTDPLKVPTFSTTEFGATGTSIPTNINSVSFDGVNTLAGGDYLEYAASDGVFSYLNGIDRPAVTPHSAAQTTFIVFNDQAAGTLQERLLSSGNGAATSDAGFSIGRTATAFAPFSQYANGSGTFANYTVNGATPLPAINGTNDRSLIVSVGEKYAEAAPSLNDYISVGLYHSFNAVGTPSTRTFTETIYDNTSSYFTNSVSNIGTLIVGAGMSNKLGAPSVPYSFRGSIAEVISYDRKLTCAERNMVVSYIKTKWEMPNLVDFDCSILITSITSTTANGTYGVGGGPISITVNFDDILRLGSKVDATLDTGDVVTLTTFGSALQCASGIANTCLIGSYTPTLGDTSADLDVTSIVTSNAFDYYGNNPSTTLPTGVNSLAGSKAIVIDTTAPTLVSATLTGTNTYTLTFTEPISPAPATLSTALFGAPAPTSATVDASGKIVLVYPSAPTAIQLTSDPAVADAASNDVVTFTITVPTTPTDFQILNLTDSGLVGDNITNDTTPTFAGTAAGACTGTNTVNVYSGVFPTGTLIATGTCSGGAYINATVSTPFAEATMTNFYVTQSTAIGGVESAPLTGLLDGTPVGSLTIDVTDPTLTLTTNPILTTTTTITGTSEAGATITFTGIACTGPVIANASGIWTCTVSGVLGANAPYTIDATDGAGNTATQIAGNIGHENIRPIRTGSPRKCSDNKDNDNDGLKDKADPDCHTDGNASNDASYKATLSENTKQLPVGVCTTSFFTENMSRGLKGTQIDSLQKFLNKFNGTTAEALVVDNIYGRKTQAAVSAFQTLRGIKIDQIVGPQTRGEIHKAMCEKQITVTDIN